MLYDDWNNKRIFKIEASKFKKKKYIYTSPFKTYCQGFNNYTLYPYIYSDVFSKLYRMQGYNVLYSILINNLNDDTLSYSRLRGESFNSLRDKYLSELKDMCVGFDDEKLITYSDNSFVKFVQKIFKQMCDDEIVLLKKKQCFTDFSGHTIYYPHQVKLVNDKYIFKLTGENAYSKTLDVYVIDLSKLNVLDSINNLNINDDLRGKLYDIIGIKNGITLPFYSPDKKVSLNADFKNPEHIAGVSFICLNPKYMDITPYVSDDEALSINDYINSPDADYDLFTGIILKNPLMYTDVPVFASYKFDEAVHVGIPSLDIIDHMFSSEIGLDAVEIIEDGKLINSDFLDGMTEEEAKDEIISAFQSEGIGETFCYTSENELIISAFEELGILIPAVSNYLNEITVLDEKYYPVYYNNRFKPVITNEDKLDNNLSLKRMTFSEHFVLALSNTYARIFDMFAGNDEFLRSESIYDDFTDMLGILSLESSEFEILYNVIFNKYFETFGKKYYPFSQILELTTSGNQAFIGEQQRLGVSFVDEVLNKYSVDAYRMYLLADSLNDELSITLGNVEKYSNLINRIRNAYSTEFEQSAYENSYANSFFKEQNKLLASLELKKYTNNLVSFFDSFVEPHKITKSESYKYLIMLSLVSPEIAEELNKSVFKEKYSIFYNEFPR